MRSLLTITTPAADLHLLTIEQMREAAGITGGGSDAALQAMGLRLAAAVAAECNVAIGFGAEPTLLREELTETFRGVCCEVLVLSRRHSIEIASVTVDGVVLDEDEYEVDPESGILTRLDDDEPTGWNARKIIVVYDAGFEDVPGDLAMTMMDFFRLAWREKSRDPSVKAQEIDVAGIDRTRTEYWAGAIPGQTGEGAVPDLVAGQLSRFRNLVIA